MNRVHECYKNGAHLHDGYAPFCKHLFIENFVGARVGSMEITEDNRQCLLSAYEKRRSEELAVLSRCENLSFRLCGAVIQYDDAQILI